MASFTDESDISLGQLLCYYILTWFELILLTLDLCDWEVGGGGGQVLQIHYSTLANVLYISRLWVSY